MASSMEQLLNRPVPMFVNSPDPRTLEKFMEGSDQVTAMDIVAVLLSLVAEYGVGRVRDLALYQVS